LQVLLKALVSRWQERLLNVLAKLKSTYPRAVYGVARLSTRLFAL
jgi:hypothetical protein